MVALKILRYFNPRTPCGVRPDNRECVRQLQPISIHAPRVGCDIISKAKKREGRISIHAPRVGCDLVAASCIPTISLISIHAPRVGCDDFDFAIIKATEGFQSTHPVWGATRSKSFRLRLSRFQSTHPVWGATQAHHPVPCTHPISIHAPRVGCDVNLPSNGSNDPLFQSTHPVWGATTLLGKFGHLLDNFNPRTPCGVRLLRNINRVTVSDNFNPRTPCGVRHPYLPAWNPMV